VASAYVDAFFAETVEHFRREEEILFPLYVRHAGSTPCSSESCVSIWSCTGSCARSEPRRPQAISRRKP
jgi:hypothetical protein